VIVIAGASFIIEDIPTALWHLHSKEINGFYQSDVVVSAETKTAAIDEAVVSYEAYLREHWREFGFLPAHPARPSTHLDDFDTAQEADSALEIEISQRRTLMRDELQISLSQIKDDALVMVRN